MASRKVVLDPLPAMDDFEAGPALDAEDSEDRAWAALDAVGEGGEGGPRKVLLAPIEPESLVGSRSAPAAHPPDAARPAERALPAVEAEPRSAWRGSSFGRDRPIGWWIDEDEGDEFEAGPALAHLPPAATPSPRSTSSGDSAPGRAPTLLPVRAEGERERGRTGTLPPRPPALARPPSFGEGGAVEAGPALPTGGDLPRRPSLEPLAGGGMVWGQDAPGVGSVRRNSLEPLPASPRLGGVGAPSGAIPSGAAGAVASQRIVPRAPLLSTGHGAPAAPPTATAPAAAAHDDPPHTAPDPKRVGIGEPGSSEAGSSTASQSQGSDVGGGERDPVEGERLGGAAVALTQAPEGAKGAGGGVVGVETGKAGAESEAEAEAEAEAEVQAGAGLEEEEEAGLEEEEEEEEVHCVAWPLPSDVTSHILCLLDWPCLVRARAVCRAFRTAATADRPWAAAAAAAEWGAGEERQPAPDTGGEAMGRFRDLMEGRRLVAEGRVGEKMGERSETPLALSRVGFCYRVVFCYGPNPASRKIAAALAAELEGAYKVHPVPGGQEGEGEDDHCGRCAAAVVAHTLVLVLEREAGDPRDPLRDPLCMSLLRRAAGPRGSRPPRLVVLCPAVRITETRRDGFLLPGDVLGVGAGEERAWVLPHVTAWLEGAVWTTFQSYDVKGSCLKELREAVGPPDDEVRGAKGRLGSLKEVLKAMAGPLGSLVYNLDLAPATMDDQIATLSEARMLVSFLRQGRNVNNINVRKRVELPAGALRRGDLTSLVLCDVGLKDVDAIILAGCLVDNTSLEKVNVSNNHVGDVGGADLIQTLVGHPRLTDLNLDDNMMGDRTANALAAALKDRRCRLRVVVASNNAIGNEGMSAVMAAMRANTTTEWLSLAFVKVADTGAELRVVSSMVEANRSLKKLSLGGNDLGYRSGGPQLAGAVARNAFLEELELSGFYLPVGALRRGELGGLDMEDKGLNVLDAVVLGRLLGTSQDAAEAVTSIAMGRNGILDAGLAALAEAMGALKLLDVLDVHCNGVGPPGGGALRSILRTSRKLRVLRAGDNPLGEGYRGLAEGIGAAASLEVLDLGNTRKVEGGVQGELLRGLLKAVARCRTLTDLDLTGHHLEAEGEALSECLLQGKRQGGGLRRLAASSSNLGDGGVVALAAVLPSTRVEALDLCFTYLGDAGACALGEAIGAGAPLRVLRLNTNNIGPAGAEGLAAGIARGGAVLEELELHRNGVGERGAIALAEAFEGQSPAPLAVLVLTNNGISATGTGRLIEVLKGLDTIRRVDLDGNEVSGGDLMHANRNVFRLKKKDEKRASLDDNSGPRTPRTPR